MAIGVKKSAITVLKEKPVILVYKNKKRVKVRVFYVVFHTILVANKLHMTYLRFCQK